MNAFVLRIRPGEGANRVPEALRSNDLIVGWSCAMGLLNPSLTWAQFRQIVKDQYHSADSDFRKAGAAAGNLWRFIRDMHEGDLVVVPEWDHFYVAKVSGPARHEPDCEHEDTSYRRKVEWLNDRKPIPRRLARAALQSRMKSYHTCAWATDLIQDIQDALDTTSQGKAPSFADDLRQKLVVQTLTEIRTGRLDSYGFETLIQKLLASMGAAGVPVIVPRRSDEGADVVAVFSLASTFNLKLAVQAKHYQPTPPVPPEVVEQLVAGMDAEDADFGWVVTSGTFSTAAEERRAKYEADSGYRIELVDGEQLAAMIVEVGLKLVAPK